MKRKSKDEKKTSVQSSEPNLAPSVPQAATQVMVRQLRRSVSCEEIPSSAEPGVLVKSHQIMGANGQLLFQGNLNVHRHGATTTFIPYWCVFDGATINCFTSQSDQTLTMSVSLLGSQICEASAECGRPNCFKVWHMETGQCIYFLADDTPEFQKWFTQITTNADRIDNPPTQPGLPGKSVFFVHANVELHASLARPRSNTLPLRPHEHGDNVSVESSNTGQGSSDIPTPLTAFYRGHLKKASHTGKWKDRYCVVKDGILSILHSPSDKAPIIAIETFGSSIELVNVPPQNTQRFVFKLKLESSEKTHTFAALSETEMFAWVSALRDSSYEKPGLEQQRSQSDLSAGGSVNNSPALSVSSI